MKVIKDSYLVSAKYGRLPQQIPTIAIGEEPEMELIPDEWVMYLNGSRLRNPRADALLFLSPIGFEANMERIKDAYITGMPGRGQNRQYWDYYLSNVLGWYDNIETINRDEIRLIRLRAEKKVQTIQELLDRYFPAQS